MSNQTIKVQRMEILIQRLSQDLRYAHLREKARKEEHSEVPQWLIKVLKVCLGLVFVDPDKLHGDAYVTQELQEHSEVTAGVVTSSHIIDAPANLQIFWYGFKDLGNPVALIGSIALTMLVLAFTNWLAVGTSGYKQNNKGWSRIAMSGLILMHILQAFVAGISIELLNNQPELADNKAKELIEQIEKKVETLKKADSNPRYLAAKKECAEKEEKLLHLPHPPRREQGASTWDSIFTKAYGSWEENYGSYGSNKKDWDTVPENNLPKCHLRDRLFKQLNSTYESENKKLQSKLVLRTQAGNDLIWLNQQFPDIYDSYFTKVGELKSGVEAARMALNNTSNKIVKLDVSGLGFSLFFIMISAITSSISCIINIAFAYRQDNQKSKSEAVENIRNAWLDQKQADFFAYQKFQQIDISRSNGHPPEDAQGEN